MNVINPAIFLFYCRVEITVVRFVSHQDITDTHGGLTTQQVNDASPRQYAKHNRR